MGLVWELPITDDFGRAEKYVLLAYADHADQNGKNIFPSIALISAKTGYEERSVQSITRTLETQGFLVPDGQGPHGTNRHCIPISRLPDGGAKISPVVQKFAPEGIAPEEIAPEPSVEVKDSNTTTTGGGEIFKIFESEIGVLTPLIADAVQDALSIYPAGWIVDAIHEAALNNKRNWKYCEAILKRWKAEGRNSPKPKGAPPAPKTTVKPSNRDIIRKVAAHVR
jgi:DnaD/phage-associated family protein